MSFTLTQNPSGDCNLAFYIGCLDDANLFLLFYLHLLTVNALNKHIIRFDI